MQERLNGLFVATRDARKIFRLGKFINELQSMQQAFSNVNIDFPELTLQILTRLSFFFYWIFDNLGCLSSIKVIKMDANSLSQKGNLAWFLGVVFSLISLARNLKLNSAKESKIKKSCDPSLQTTKQSLDAVRKSRREIKENLVKNLGDLIPSSAFAKVPEKLFKKSMPESWIGLGGLVAGTVASYQIWFK